MFNTIKASAPMIMLFAATAAHSAPYKPHTFALGPWPFDAPANLPFTDGTVTPSGNSFGYFDGTTPFEVNGEFEIWNYGIDDVILERINLDVSIPINSLSSEYPNRLTLSYDTDDIYFIYESNSEDEIYVPGLVWPQDQIVFDDERLHLPDGTGFDVRTTLGLGYNLASNDDDMTVPLHLYTIEVSVWCTGEYLLSGCNPGPLFDMQPTTGSLSGGDFSPSTGVLHSSGTVSFVPVPTAVHLLLLGLSGLGLIGRRRTKE